MLKTAVSPLTVTAGGFAFTFGSPCGKFDQLKSRRTVKVALQTTSQQYFFHSLLIETMEGQLILRGIMILRSDSWGKQAQAQISE